MSIRADTGAALLSYQHELDYWQAAMETVDRARRAVAKAQADLASAEQLRHHARRRLDEAARVLDHDILATTPSSQWCAGCEARPCRCRDQGRDQEKG